VCLVHQGDDSERSQQLGLLHCGILDCSLADVAGEATTISVARIFSNDRRESLRMAYVPVCRTLTFVKQHSLDSLKFHDKIDGKCSISFGLEHAIVKSSRGQDCDAAPAPDNIY
jgi:hypothetical protein